MTANSKAIKSTSMSCGPNPYASRTILILNRHRPNRSHGFGSEIYDACGDDGDVHYHFQEGVRNLGTVHPEEDHTAAEHTADPAGAACGLCICAQPHLLRWLQPLLQLDYQEYRLLICVLQSHQLHLLRVLHRDPSHRLDPVRRIRRLVGHWDQSRMIADPRDSLDMGTRTVGMVGLVGHMELVSARERGLHSSAGAGIAVVVGSPADGEGRHTIVAVGEECWRSSEQEGIVGLLEHSWAEEDIAADHRSPAGHKVVEEDNHPFAGHRRSNHCLTL